MTTRYQPTRDAPLVAGKIQTTSVILDLTVNDYVELYVYQDSGLTRQVVTAAGYLTPWFGMARVG